MYMLIFCIYFNYVSYLECVIIVRALALTLAIAIQNKH